MSTHRSLFLNLTHDIIFKSYFKLHTEALKSLLKAFLPLPENSSIQKITILDSLLPSLSQEEKSSIMDLRLQMESGEFVNVEMQAFPHTSFTKRILLYWAKNYSHQLKTGQEYEKLYPVYSLVFSTFNLFSETNSFYNSFSIRSDSQPYFCFTENMRLVVVELSKFQKRRIRDLLDLREQWCYVLKESRRMGERESKELSFKDPEMGSVMSYLRKFSQDEQYQILEEAREKNRRDRAARDSDKFNEGREEGKKEGREKGREEGQTYRQNELILSMLQKQLEISLIAEITGLSEEEISKFKKKLC